MNTQVTTDPIRVLLVDDHTLFRKGLAELLEQRGTITVAGIAGNGEDALRILAEARPDVIITDLNMPPNGGLSLLRQLIADGWNGPVLVLTVSDAEEDLAAAASAKADTMKLLTAREREILQHLSQGLSNKAIARVLDISHDTVKLHVKHILAKLNLSSRVEAAVFAVEQKAAGQGRRTS
ncbi:MAG: LuxR C-terminal-related transcriptional regulator [Rhodocyclales bacterium]|nr:LuxR C-terminal-related transcriptional regulator [Rhodocyclales bacterium]